MDVSIGLRESWFLFQAFVDSLQGVQEPQPLRVPLIVNEHGGLGPDVVVFIVFSVVLFVINWTIRLAIVKPLAWFALVPADDPVFGKIAGIKLSADALQKHRDDKLNKVNKFCETVMEQIFYGMFTIFGVLIVSRQEWAWPSLLWWKGFNDHTPHPVSGVVYSNHAFMTRGFAAYYIIYAARYLQAIVTVFLEHKRKDFVEMQMHHLTTVSLVAISYAYGWTRVGVIVMLLLDPADVFLHAAKACKYIYDENGKEKNGLYLFASNRLFEAFAIVFIVTRLMLYPYVCWSAHIEATRYFPKGFPEWTCVVLLYVLLGLQVYWFVLILKVAYRSIILGDLGDVRSDSDEDVRDEVKTSATTRKVTQSKKRSKKAD